MTNIRTLQYVYFLSMHRLRLPFPSLCFCPFFPLSQFMISEDNVDKHVKLVEKEENYFKAFRLLHFKHTISLNHFEICFHSKIRYIVYHI